jgi:transcriptional antiterminator RfaH
MSAWWACAQTAPHQERAAQHMLSLHGFQSYCPRLRVQRYQHGRKLTLQAPFFPSYLFVAIVDGHWWAARWCPHITRILLRGNLEPAVVPDAVVDAIKQREVDGLVQLAPASDFRRGDKLRITEGVFAGHLALFGARRPRDRVAVLLILLGSQQRVELGKDAIEAAG